MGQSCKRRTNARHREQGRRQSRDISGHRQRVWYIISHIKVHGRVAYLATLQLGNNSPAPSRHCGTGAATSHLDWACVVFGVIWKEPWALGTRPVLLHCHYSATTRLTRYNASTLKSRHGPFMVPPSSQMSFPMHSMPTVPRLLGGMYSVSR